MVFLFLGAVLSSKLVNSLAKKERIPLLKALRKLVIDEQLNVSIR